MRKLFTILFAVFVLNGVAIAITPHGTCVANTTTSLNYDFNYFEMDTPSSQVCNVPITLTNSQNTATPDSFEQMVTVNSSLFSSLEMTGLQNIEFTVGSPAPTGTVLQAWIESGNSSSSTNTIYWVNLDNNIIPANGTLIVYMNFMSSAVLSSTGPTGEAPDISGTYAQYDNGGLVFPYVYTRWGGLSNGTLPTTTNGDAVNGGNISSSATSNSYGSMSITSGTTYTQITFSGSQYNYSYNYPDDILGAYYSTTPASSYTYPTVLESKVNIGDPYSWFGTGYGQEEEGWGAVIANDNNNGSQPTYSVRSNWNLQSSFNCGAGTNSIADYTSLSASSPVANVWTIMLNNNNDTDQLFNIMYNYIQIPGQTFPLTIDGNGSTAYQSGSACGGLGTLYGYFGTAQNRPDAEPYEQIYWTRTRLFPPNGIMPVASINDTIASGALALIFPIDTSICAGASVTLSAEGGLSYTWSNNDTGSIITVNPATTSVFVVTAKSGCGTDSATATITVDTAAQILTILPLDTTICNGQSVTLYVNGGSGGFNLNWSPSTSLSDSTGSNVLATPSVTTTYVVTGVDSLGCTATGTDVIAILQGLNKPTLKKDGNFLVSSATEGNQWYRNSVVISGATSESYNATDTGCYWATATNIANGCGTTSDTICITPAGINQLTITSNQLSVYPNPTGGEVFINISSSVADVKDWNLQITDVLGRTVFTKQSLNYTNDIDLSSLPGGVYFIAVINKTGRAVVPVVKE